MELKITKTVENTYIIKLGQYYYAQDQINNPYFIAYNEISNICDLYLIKANIEIEFVSAYAMNSDYEKQKLLNDLLNLGIELGEEE